MKQFQTLIIPVMGLIFMVGLLDASESIEVAQHDRPTLATTGIIVPRDVDYDAKYRDVDKSELIDSSEPAISYFIASTDNNGFTHIAANAWPSCVYWPNHISYYPFYWDTPYWHSSADAYYTTTYSPFRSNAYPYYGLSSRYNRDRYYISAWERYEYARLSFFFRDQERELTAKDLDKSSLMVHEMGLFNEEEESPKKKPIGLQLTIMDDNVRGGLDSLYGLNWGWSHGWNSGRNSWYLTPGVTLISK